MKLTSAMDTFFQIAVVPLSVIVVDLCVCQREIYLAMKKKDISNGKETSYIHRNRNKKNNKKKKKIKNNIQQEQPLSVKIEKKFVFAVDTG